MLPDAGKPEIPSPASCRSLRPRLLLSGSYCPEAKLGFEIDGFAHDTGDRPKRDTVRDEWLFEQGITVIRIPAADVLKSVHDVAETITTTLTAPARSPSP